MPVGVLEHEYHVFISDFLLSLVLESRGVNMKTGPGPSCTEQLNVTNCTRKHSSRMRTARFSSSGRGRSAQSPRCRLQGVCSTPLDADPGVCPTPPPRQTSGMKTPRCRPPIGRPPDPCGQINTC